MLKSIMIQSPDVSSLLTDMIYGSLFGECSWQDFLDRLAQTSPGGKAALHYHDLTSSVAHVPFMSGFSQSEIDQFTSHFASVNPWIPRLDLVPVGHGNQDNYRITLVRLHSDAFTEFLEGPTVAVIVEPIVATPLNERRDLLMQLYKLTATEIRIASSIASGHSPREVAMADDISYETVRTHLRNIYAKLGVNSRVGLVSLLMR